MSDNTAIEWTDATWNPVRGCTRVSAGCVNCYAEGVAARFSGPGMPYEGLAERTSKGPRWTGKVALVETALTQPLRWTRPRRIFVNSMSDLFHPEVPDAFIDRVFAVMALATRHIFQVLTKRPERMREYLSRPAVEVRIGLEALGLCMEEKAKRSSSKLGDGVKIKGSDINSGALLCWPLPNVHLGVSVEDQAAADKRIPHLRATPAAVRFLSCEPLLGPINLGRSWVNWVIVGGESGPNSRPMHPDWARSLRDQCEAAGVPFFFKQWGEWAFAEFDTHEATHWFGPAGLRPRGQGVWASDISAKRVGKSRAGRLLDGREHNAMPS